MRKTERTALHFVWGCFLLMWMGCDIFSPPKPPIVPADTTHVPVDLSDYCVIRLHTTVFEVDFKDTIIECTDMNDLDSALSYFGGSKQISKVVITWEGDVTYGTVIEVLDELKKDSITNYTLMKAEDLIEAPKVDSPVRAIRIRARDTIRDSDFVIDVRSNGLRCNRAKDTLSALSLAEIGTLLRKNGGDKLDSTVVIKVNIHHTKSNFFADMIDTLYANGVECYYCYLNVERYR